MEKHVEDYEQPFDAILEFEQAVSEFTGAPFVVATDCCTHALELCVRYLNPGILHIPHRTYISVLMLAKKLGRDFVFEDIEWTESYHMGSDIWDCARVFKQGMYIPGTYQCISFGVMKPMKIGTGGAILLDSGGDYHQLKQMAYDGRQIHSHRKWGDQKCMRVGYHYMMRPEFAVKGLNMLSSGDIGDPAPFNYPDLRDIAII